MAEALVLGVDEVDLSGLEVRPWARDEMQKSPGSTRGDQDVREAITRELGQEPLLASDAIEVAVSDGVATLWGSVDTLRDRELATRAARSIAGVWRVKNQLKVRPEDPPADRELEQRLLRSLERDPYLERRDLSAVVIDGEAHLYGTVDSRFERERAEDVAGRLYGLTAISNHLAVQPDDEPVATATVFDYGSRVGIDYDEVTWAGDVSTTRSDWAIAEDIRDELFWSPFVDGDDVTVAVEDGIARLTGVVPSWDDHWDAQENAFEGGAIGVDNDLLVNDGPAYYQP